MNNRKFLLPLAASIGALLSSAPSDASTTGDVTASVGVNPASANEGFVLSRAGAAGVQVAQEDTGHSSHSSHDSHSSHSSHVSGS